MICTTRPLGTIEIGDSECMNCCILNLVTHRCLIVPKFTDFEFENFELFGRCYRACSARGGGHSHRPCTSTRDRGQDVGQVAKVENLSSQRVKANNFSWSKWSKLVQRSTSGGCGLISFEVGQKGQGQLLDVVKRSRPKIGGQES